MRRQDRFVPFPWGSQAWRDEYARLRKKLPDDWARAQIRMMNFCWRCVARRGERCGAMTRKGEPCKAKAMLKTGRCRNHGGLSTGPRTETGKARAKENLLLRWKR